MKLEVLLTAVALALVSGAVRAELETKDFNAGWEFALEPATGLVDRVKSAIRHGCQPAFENELGVYGALQALDTWRPVEVPHDWAIAGPFRPDGDAQSGKLPWQGVGYYRNATLVLTTNEVQAIRKDGVRYMLAFDGVMARSRVFLNGVPVGGNDYGYLGYRVDLSPCLRPGANTVIVRADTLSHRSRWYPGAGMIRPVRLERYSGNYVVPDTMRISWLKLSDDDYRVTASFRTAREGAKNVTFDQKGVRRWDVDDPQFQTFVWEGQSFRYGIREARFDKDRGFFLNGRRLPLKGVCLHSDLGILGMAFNRSAARRQLRIMREMGVNAIRTAHNCPAPELLDLCDEMGFVVWDECFDKWDRTSGRPDDVALEPYVEDALRRFVRRDRLHPSVVIWSIGNEIESCEPASGTLTHDGTTPERVARFAAAVREEDPTRPVGIASCEWYDVVSSRGDYDALDVVGYNYLARYSFYRQRKPWQTVMLSESASCVSSYGCYALPGVATNKQDFGAARQALEIDSMDRNATEWGDLPDREFERMERDAYVGGEFVRTGIDYLGEPVPVSRKSAREFGDLSVEQSARSSYFGVCDLLALPKDRFYLYRSHWARERFTLHLAPDRWTFPGMDGKQIPVYVYSNAEEVELVVNGKSFGRVKRDLSVRSAPEDFWNIRDVANEDYYAILRRYRFVFEGVTYEPGAVTAVAYGKDGAKLGEATVRTAGAPAKVVLEPESGHLSADGITYVFVKVTATDAAGTQIPDARDDISFAVEGPGEIVAVGNSDERSHKSFKEVSHHPLCHGRAGLFLRRKPGKTGAVTLRAEAKGLASATVRFD